ncbi:methyl-accepting chemotaxis protein [Pseudomonas sp. MSSRFD41]|uniref:methyl-accepting chemotaxis protein n=1 Tax=Pseudomonas sp. MSSRFD41 TaxID=1310370 RepID=UPI00163A169F|nr:methyl-accepting chemotaxis protein [Pseudomonas sp. MSSRFD41]MBC2659093.1 methyl-accepting chemotaxis protein [Pseudomonas sp. MSSRFD41]
MKLRLTKKTLLTSLGAIALLTALGVQQYQLSLLRGSLEGTAEKAKLDALLSRMSKSDDRLDAIAGKPLVTQEDFSAAQKAISNRVDVAQDYAKRAHDLAIDVAHSAANSSELLVIKADVESLSGAVQRLSKPEKPSAAPTPSKPARPKPAAKAKAPPAPPEPPPFQMFGIEYRGGERFLSIAPSGSTRLSQIYLVRPGDVVAGTQWRLKALNETTATFDASGSTKTLSLQP